MRSRLNIAVIVLSIVVPASAQQAKGDKEQLEALVHEYTRLEDAGDMQAQAKLMAPDRWWHGAGGRRTDNAIWMKVQEENIAANRQRFPGVRVIREARDLQIRFVTPTVAVTSFTWFANRIVPGDLPADKRQALGPPPIPVVYSQVWAKGSDGWKMVSSHQSPLYALP
jgi:hypothetical protein